MFTALLMSATYLDRLARYLVSGIAPSLVGELVALFIPALLIKTFSMATLLGSLLAFGRLSSDSEIVALRAAGLSLTRIVRPVAAFSTLIAIVTFVSNDVFVPAAGKEATVLENKIARMQGGNLNDPKTIFVVEHGKLRAAIIAQGINPANQTLHNVTLNSYDENAKLVAVLTTPMLTWRSKDDWICAGAHIVSMSAGHDDIDVKGEIWPGEIPKLHTNFQDLIALADDDFDAVSMKELRDRIDSHRKIGDKTADELINYEYGYWNKLSVPLAAVVFGVLGAVLGIRNHRTGTATGFALAVAIIFGYVTMMRFLNQWAMGGVIPAWVASFAPLFLGSVAAGTIMQRRNG